MNLIDLLSIHDIYSIIREYIFPENPVLRTVCRGLRDCVPSDPMARSCVQLLNGKPVYDIGNLDKLVNYFAKVKNYLALRNLANRGKSTCFNVAVTLIKMNDWHFEYFVDGTDVEISYMIKYLSEDLLDVYLKQPRIKSHNHIIDYYIRSNLGTMTCDIWIKIFKYITFDQELIIHICNLATDEKIFTNLREHGLLTEIPWKDILSRAVPKIYKWVGGKLTIDDILKVPSPNYEFCKIIKSQCDDKEFCKTLIKKLPTINGAAVTCIEALGKIPKSVIMRDIPPYKLFDLANSNEQLVRVYNICAEIKSEKFMDEFVRCLCSSHRGKELCIFLLKNNAFKRQKN